MAVDKLSEVNIPDLELAPIKTGVGQIRCLLREGGPALIHEISEAQVSARCKDPLYTLATGEKILISSRSRIERPIEADGILHQGKDGTLRWKSHKSIDLIRKDAKEKGWSFVANKISESWNGKFSYKSEQIKSDGTIDTEKGGLRPPQLGALHAIGAHWSLYDQSATIVMPTGTGKTETILSVLAALVRGPLLVVVPSDVLRTQTTHKFLTFGLLRTIGVLSTDAHNPVVGIVTKRPRSVDDLEMFKQCNVIIGTMSSLSGGSAIPLGPEISKRVDTLIVDEAHHLGADGWEKFRSLFSDRRVLQFTATPYRRDGKIVDGKVIYDYPLGMAQNDGYFKRISFEPIFEIEESRADQQIAETAVKTLKSDIEQDLNHLIMARCVSIDRATSVHKIYNKIAPEFNPLLVHSALTDTDERIGQLRSGKSRIVVCVNMLGEGFDLPELKIAAIHDIHKSLAVLFQFTGRFTRSTGHSIGDATVVANIASPNVSIALERLYSEDADWNQLLSEMSSEAGREHADLVAFLNDSMRLDDEDEDSDLISHKLLHPTLSTLIYNADQFHPKRFYNGLPDSHSIHRVWLHKDMETLYFVTKSEPLIKWTRSKSLRDRQWALFVMHYDSKRRLLFLASSDKSSNFKKLAEAVGANTQIDGDQIFRSLGRVNRLIFQNIGVKKHGRRNLGFALYTGSDVETALSVAERAGSVKSNLSGTGWEDGRPVTIGCSYKGRIWSKEQGSLPRLIHWCENVGDKIIDSSIDTTQIISNVLIPEEIEELPYTEILSIEWPVEILRQSEERVTLKYGAQETSLATSDILLTKNGRSHNNIEFQIVEADTGILGNFILAIGGEKGYEVSQTSGAEISIAIGKINSSLAEYFNEYPPLVRFMDLTELDGNLFIHPQNSQSLVIPEECFDPWSWDGVDNTKESFWKGGVKRTDSIQWYAAQHFVNDDFDVVFDDDASGEAADLVCINEYENQIKVVLVHCKYSGGKEPGRRVKDVVEVSSQAVRSAKWKWKFRDLCRHLQTRESKLVGHGRSTRFILGEISDLNRFAKVSRYKEVSAEILIVQPGLSKSNLTAEQSTVLAAAVAYLKETIGVDLRIICSI